MEHTVSRTEKLDALFGTPVFAVLIAIFCNALVASLPFLLCLLGLAVLVYLFF